MTFAHGALAVTYECIPPAVGVFGLDGPPNWFNAGGGTANPIHPGLDDPRWNGATRDDLPQFGGGAMPEGAFRAVQDGSNLYLTLQAIVDPNGTTPSYDGVYIGFASTTAATAKLIHIVLNTDNVQGVALAPATAWRYSAAAWNGSPVPAWITNTAAWAGTGTAPVNAAWAVNVVINLAALHMDADIGGSATSNARFFYALDINTHVAPPPAVSTTLVWPPGAAFSITAGTPASSMDPTLWGQTILGVTDPSCPTGVSITPLSIGTMPVTAGVPSTVVTYGGTAATANTFVAVLQNPPTTAGAVKADFRLADWGSQIGDSSADWKSILPPGATTPVNGSDPTHLEQITWLCHDSTGATDSCPTLPNPSAPTDQCMLVELSSTGGITPVHFVQDSARRNLDFVHASSFTRDARLSVNGLAPLVGGGPEREVYVYVKTTNMPANLDPGRQPPQGQDAGPVAPPVNARQAREKGGPAVYEKTSFEALRDAWPTLEVHVYHDTGRTEDTGHGPTRILEPQVPFGYLVAHTGSITGWRHALAGRGVAFDEISPDFFRVRIPNNGKVTISTGIDAVEPAPPPLPPEPPPWWHCNCSMVGGAPSSPLALGLGGLGIAALVIRARRRKARSQG